MALDENALTEVICLDAFWLVLMNWKKLIITILLGVYAAPRMHCVWKLFLQQQAGKNNGLAAEEVGALSGASFIKNSKSTYSNDLMLKLLDRIPIEEFNNAPLSELYLLGYASQRIEFFKKSKIDRPDDADNE